MSVEPSKSFLSAAGRQLKSHWKWLLFSITLVAISVVATLLLYSPKPTPSQTVTVTVPPTGAGGVVSVVVPGPIVDKLGASHDGGLTSFGTGLLTVLGTLAGAGLTYLTTSQRNKQDQLIADREVAHRRETRQQEIRDRSRQACIDVLRTGQQVTGATRLLWVSINNGDPSDRIEKNAEELRSVVQGWYSVGEVLSLSVPPTAATAFDAYKSALNAYVISATRWKGYFDEVAKRTAIRSSAQAVNGPSAPTETPSADRCKALHDEVIAARKAFLAATAPVFHEDAFT